MPHGECQDLAPRSESHSSFPCLSLLLLDYQIPPVRHIRGVGARCICSLYGCWDGLCWRPPSCGCRRRARRGGRSRHGRQTDPCLSCGPSARVALRDSTRGAESCGET